MLAVNYLSESCILGFVSTSQICCGDVFAAEDNNGEVSPHMLLCLRYDWCLGIEVVLGFER